MNIVEIKPKMTAYNVAKDNGISLKVLQKANKGVDLNRLRIGQKLIVPSSQKQAGHEYTVDKMTKVPEMKSSKGLSQGFLIKNAKYVPGTTSKSSQKTSAKKTSVATAPQSKTTPKSASSIMTKSKFETTFSQEAKELKKELYKIEGKVANAYFSADGNSTIGCGHLLQNKFKPDFLKKIEALKISPAAKNKKLRDAINIGANKNALKEALKKELQDAINNTGIKDVPTTVSSDLKLTDSQIELLLNSDLKKAQNGLDKTFGADIAKLTSNQKKVALDIAFNSGNMLNAVAPEFVKQLKANKIGSAQAELNIFKADGKVQLGLLRRAYGRMMLINDNNGISDEAKEKLLTAYNEYCKDKGRKKATNFAQIESMIKA